MASASAALAQDQATDQDSEGLVMEEVTITGIRRAMIDARDFKREDGRIVDAIVAEDIGKLPDNNIAEALQRITGVAINRDFGVGSEVSIRGLPQNRVELNGRSTMGSTIGASRNGVDFQDFPASFLTAVEVIKSPTAKMIEGALGGTINLKTARPLNLDDRIIQFDVAGEYADRAENWAPIVSGQYGDKWETDSAGTFGVMAMLSYQDRELRQDTYQASLFVYSPEALGLSPAQNTPSGNYVVPVEPKIEPWTEQRERTAFDLTLEWAPASGNGRIYLDTNYTEREGGQQAYSILSVGGYPVATSSSSETPEGALNNYRLENHFAIPKTWTEFRNTDSFSNALGGEWTFGDTFTVSAEYSKAEADSSDPASELNLRAHDREAEAANPSGSNELITPVTIINGLDKAPSVVYDAGEIYTMTDNYVLREFRHRERDLTNAEDAWRLDFDWEVLDWMSLKAGYRGTDREYEYMEQSFRVKDIHKDMYDSDGNPTVVYLNDLPNVVTPPEAHNVFDHTGFVGTNHLTPFTVYDARALQNADYTYGWVQDALAGSNFNTPGNSDGYIDPNGTLQSNLTDTLSAYSLIEEETTAFYLQANMDFEHVRMILGGRYVKTDLTTTAYNQEGTELVSDTNDYDDFLPSFNATVDLTENSLLRFSWADVMRRPDFNQLSPTYEYNSDFILADRGNPYLDPYRATQFDLAWEWYFGNGNMVSVTAFYKDVESFLTSYTYCAYEPQALAQQNTSGIYDNTCIRPEPTGHSDTWVFSESQEEFDAFVAAGRNGILTTTVGNGSAGEVSGFELGYQQMFDMLPGAWGGLGINANYTYADSETPEGTPMLDISENSYNVQLFWEYWGIGVRLAYTYRDAFLDETGQKRVDRVGELVAYPDSEPTRGHDYRDDLSQLDLAVNWDFYNTPGGAVFSAYGFVYNLTGEPLINTSVTGTPWQIRETDTRYTLGIRARF